MITALQVYQRSATEVTNHEPAPSRRNHRDDSIGALLGFLGDPVIEILVVERYVQPAELGLLEDEEGERLRP